jgi:hypothetical protein
MNSRNDRVIFKRVRTANTLMPAKKQRLEASTPFDEAAG